MTTGVEPAVLLAGQVGTITREVICQDSAGFIHGVPIWNGYGAPFSARTPHHLSGLLRGCLRRAARRKRTAMMQEHIARCIQGAKNAAASYSFPPCTLECCSAQGRGEDSDDEENDDDTEGSDEEAERDKHMVRDMHDTVRTKRRSATRTWSAICMIPPRNMVMFG
ncbi:unnamed protein product [Ectocarpus sp. CCAP 1310/34]|nr:unnamed protein product [Ectocarpus sp. CCAP 1310/34]